MLRVLLISYAFPPVGGAGVQRVLKLVKYGFEYGLQPSVLSVENPSVPLRDASLLAEVPDSVDVVRAHTFEPSYRAKELAWQSLAHAKQTLRSRGRARAIGLAKAVLLPDPQVLWLPCAAGALAERLVSDPPDVVFVSGPPFSQFLLAPLARLRPGTAVVLDYRDEWSTTRTAFEMSSAAPAVVDRVMEQSVLRMAHAVTTATEAFRRELLARFSFLDPTHVHTIENGFDPADFPRTLPAPPSERFVVTYVGTLFRLTSPLGFLQALRIVHEREPELARLLEVRIVGRIVETEARLFEGSEALGVVRVGYLEHARALEELSRSHLALCLLDEAPGAERVYPAKIFEIMRLGRPCLALCPDGALADLVRTHRLGDVVAPRDANGIASLLVQKLREFRAGRAPLESAAIDIERFDRRRQAGRFAAVFREASARAQSSRTQRGSTQLSRAAG